MTYWKYIVPALLLGNASAATPMLDPTTPPLVGEVETVGYTTIDANTGAYGQPGWVQRRPFATTRVHIQRNPGEISMEQWVRAREDKGDWKFRMREEIEFGLPGRVMMDFYYDWTIEDATLDHLDFSGEIRYAFADWGKLPLNPTVYLEYKLVDDSRGGDVIEPKILLGDSFGRGWHWGVNGIYERELKGEKAEEWQVTAAISKTINETLSVGLEGAWRRETVEGGRDAPEQKVVFGPQIQWRPTKRMHVNFVTLAGLTGDAPNFEGWLVVGYNFGKVFGNGASGGNRPVSGRF